MPLAQSGASASFHVYGDYNDYVGNQIDQIRLHHDVTGNLHSPYYDVAGNVNITNNIENTVNRPSRNLVVCIDGTSNQFGQHVKFPTSSVFGRHLAHFYNAYQNTNVIELYNQLEKDGGQITYYNSGIGTYAKPSWKSLSYYKQVLDHKIDLAIAWNFEKTVIAAYQWLSENYQEGDKLFFFGFSRGAYQVRALAGMIHKVGLIHKGNQQQIPFAYELYADSNSNAVIPPQSLAGKFKSTLAFCLSGGQRGSKQQSTKPILMADRFRGTFSREVKVHFVGVWDTVSSVGIIRDKNLPLTNECAHIEVFRHALALDERRVKFLPEYVYREESIDMKEVWFSGTHSDIGGGNIQNADLDRRNSPFLWMSYEAASSGLRLNPRARENVQWKWEDLGAVKESLNGIWHLLEILPIKRTSSRTPENSTYCPHYWGGRKIQSGQKIHASVAFGSQSYIPKAILPNYRTSRDWADLVGKGDRNNSSWIQKWDGILELDIFDYSTAGIIIDKVINPTGDAKMWIYRLELMSQSSQGRATLSRVDSIPNSLINIISRQDNAIDTENRLALMQVLDRLAELGSPPLKPIQQPLLEGLLKMLDTEVLTSLIISFLSAFVNDDHLRWRILDRVRVVLAGIQNDKIDVMMSKLKLVRSLCHYVDSRNEVLHLEMVSSLKNMLPMGALDETNSILNTIGTLAQYDDGREGLREKNIIPVLLELVRYHEITVTISSLKAIENLVASDACRKDLVDSQFIATVKSGLLESSDGTIKAAYLDIVSALAAHDDTRIELSDPDMISLVYGSLQNHANIEKVCQAVSMICTFDDSRKILLDKGLLSNNGPLSTALQNKNTAMIPSIISLIMALADYDDIRAGLLDQDTDGLRQNILDQDIISLVFGFLRNRAYITEVPLVEVPMFKFLGRLCEYDNSRGVLLKKFFLSDKTLWVLFMRKTEKIEVWELGLTIVQKFIACGTQLPKEIVQVVLESFDLANLNDAIESLALRIITELSENVDSSQNMLEIGLLKYLRMEFKPTNTIAFISSLNIIVNLTAYENWRQLIMRNVIFWDLFPMLSSQDTDIRATSVQAMQSLIRNADSRLILAEKKNTDELVQILKTTRLSTSFQNIFNDIAAYPEFATALRPPMTRSLPT